MNRNEQMKRDVKEYERSEKSATKVHRKRISQRRINPQGRRVFADRRQVDCGPGCRGQRADKPDKPLEAPPHTPEQLKALKAEVDEVFKHFAVTDVMKGVKPEQAVKERIDEPGAKLLKVVQTDQARHFAEIIRSTERVKVKPFEPAPEESKAYKAKEYKGSCSGQLEAPRCDNCLFYAPNTYFPDLHCGNCHAGPVVNESDWCGDHKLDERKVE